MGAFYGTFLFHFSLFDAVPGQYGADILPIAFVMHALGWFLLSLERLTAGGALIVAWISGLLGTSYTPALAAWVLFQSFFLLLLLRAARDGRRAQIVLWASVVAYTLTLAFAPLLLA